MIILKILLTFFFYLPLVFLSSLLVFVNLEQFLDDLKKPFKKYISTTGEVIQNNPNNPKNPTIINEGLNSFFDQTLTYKVGNTIYKKEIPPKFRCYPGSGDSIDSACWGYMDFEYPLGSNTIWYNSINPNDYGVGQYPPVHPSYNSGKWAIGFIIIFIIINYFLIKNIIQIFTGV